MPKGQIPLWVEVVAAIPAAVMLWGLLAWTPRSKKQWILAGGMAIYVALYYLLFIK